MIMSPASRLVEIGEYVRHGDPIPTGARLDTQVESFPVVAIVLTCSEWLIPLDEQGKPLKRTVLGDSLRDRYG